MNLNATVLFILSEFIKFVFYAFDTSSFSYSVFYFILFYFTSDSYSHPSLLAQNGAW